MRPLGYLLAFTMAPLPFLGHAMGPPGLALPVVVVFVVFPALDALIGLDTRNPPEDEPYFWYRFLTLLWVPVNTGLLVWGIWRVMTLPMPTPFFIGHIVGIGLVTGGVGITVAHELGHRKAWLDRAAAHVLLGSVSYLHFLVEHNRGHHARVATPEDPATARLGEGWYRFYLRTVPGQWLSAWRLMARDAERKGHAVFGPRNAMLWYLLVTLAVPTALYLTLGPRVMLFFLGQSVVAFTLLELVNYIEHYGLLRRDRGDGRFEPVRPVHSWNASFRITNWLLFGLQRHSDHHADARRPYHILRHMDDAPQLPGGYPTMIMLALVPPLWRRVMDPKVKAWREANLEALVSEAA